MNSLFQDFAFTSSQYVWIWTKFFRNIDILIFHHQQSTNEAWNSKKTSNKKIDRFYSSHRLFERSISFSSLILFCFNHYKFEYNFLKSFKYFFCLENISQFTLLYFSIVRNYFIIRNWNSCQLFCSLWSNIALITLFKPFHIFPSISYLQGAELNWISKIFSTLIGKYLKCFQKYGF